MRRSESRLLPTLFDRLRDDAPHLDHEAPGAVSLSATGLRERLKRDLAYLFNTTNAEPWIDAARHPAAASSALNYGVPPLAGRHLTGRAWSEVESIIRASVLAHEPRLLPDALEILPLEARGGADCTSELSFEIRARIDARPHPLELVVRSVVDLETHRIRVVRSVDVA